MLGKNYFNFQWAHTNKVFFDVIINGTVINNLNKLFIDWCFYSTILNQGVVKSNTIYFFPPVCFQTAAV